MHRSTKHGTLWQVLVIAALVGPIASCGDMAVPTTTAQLSPSAKPARSIADVSDPCDDTVSDDCHDYDVQDTTDDYSTDPANAASWDAMDCSWWCSTYPLATKTKSDIINELSHISFAPDCQSVKTFVLNKVYSGDVRFYPQNDGNWGDYHYFTGQMHLHTSNFLNSHDLGMTLMHEGFHGYFLSGNESAAESFATSCVTN